MPVWASRPALTRFTLSSPKLAGWFAGFDRSVPRSRHVRPGAFGLMGHPTGMTAELAGDARPARGYESNPEEWLGGPWFDRRTGQPIEVTTLDPGSDPEAFSRDAMSGAVRIQTLVDVLARYRLHPEHKSLAPDEGWAAEQTRGLLLRRPVESAPVLTDLTGKEANKIIERLTGEVTDPKEYRTDYGARADRWNALVVPVLKEMGDALGTAELANRAQVHRRSVERTLGVDAAMPQASTRAKYLDAARRWCEEQLLGSGYRVGRDPVGTVWCHKEHGSVAPIRSCLVCGRPVMHPLAKYCGPTCKKRAYRVRARSQMR
jgi:hypothetical protein